jgi:hypothetical protein
MRVRVTDVVFVLTCAILSAVALLAHLPPTAKAREDVVSSANAYPVSSAHAYTVVVYLHPKCEYCTASLGLYRRLSQMAPTSQTELRFFSIVGEQDLLAYLRRAAIANPKVAHGPVPSGVRGTPTVVVYDSLGHAVASWEGRLSARQERSLLWYFQPDTPSGSTGGTRRTR